MKEKKEKTAEVKVTKGKKSPVGVRASKSKKCASEPGPLITPYGGGELVDLMPANEGKKNQLKMEANDYPAMVLNSRQMCDWEMIVTGAFSPLTGFMGQKDYDSVLANHRLANGTYWPLPVTLDVDEEFASSLKEGQSISLRDTEGYLRALMKVTSIWQPDRTLEAQRLYGETSEYHPGVNYILNEAGSFYLGGNIWGIEPPPRFDYQELRGTPAEVRQVIAALNKKVILHETRQIPHKGIVEALVEAARENDAVIFLHPIVGPIFAGDMEFHKRIKIARALKEDLVSEGVPVLLYALNMAKRFAGAKDWEWHNIIARNYGICCVSAMPDDIESYTLSRDGRKRQFFSIGDIQHYRVGCGNEIGVEVMPLKKLVYLPEESGERTGTKYIPLGDCNEREVLSSQPLSSKSLFRLLRTGSEMPDYMVTPGLKRVLPTVFPPRSRKGLVLFFCGLSGSGKSTIARLVQKKLEEIDNRPVTLLDGDIIRAFLSSELTFAKEHRILNVRRIGFVAALIAKSGGIAICSPIAPFEESRQKNREFISNCGEYIEVYVSTPLNICEERETKGFYAKARRGEIKQFTGVTDAFEIPSNSEIFLNTSNISPAEAANEIIQYLKMEGYLSNTINP